jgi:hypothetical protein
MKGLFVGLLASFGCAASVRAIAAQPLPAGLAALVRQLVVNSLQGGGDRDEMVFVAADSASAELMRSADVPTVTPPGREMPLCPGSTEADGQLTVAPVGYVVRAMFVTEPDTTTRRLRVTKSCDFRYRGRVRRFGEGATWDLRLESGRWRVVAAFDRWIT